MGIHPMSHWGPQNRATALMDKLRIMLDLVTAALLGVAGLLISCQMRYAFLVSHHNVSLCLRAVQKSSVSRDNTLMLLMDRPHAVDFSQLCCTDQAKTTP